MGAFASQSLQWKSNKYYIFCVCYVLFSIKRACHVLNLSCGACLILPYFCTLSRKRYDFRNKVNEHKRIFLFCLQLVSETFLNLSRIRDITINVHRASCNYPVFLSDFDDTRFFPTDFREILGCQISWKSVELFYADGQTDVKKLIVELLNFRTPLKKICPDVKKKEEHGIYWHNNEIRIKTLVLQVYSSVFFVIVFIWLTLLLFLLSMNEWARMFLYCNLGEIFSFNCGFKLCLVTSRDMTAMIMTTV
jgi:hypothetical protein